MRAQSEVQKPKPDLGSGPRNYQCLNPPQWVFPVVWTILYIMIAASGVKYLLTTNFQLNSGVYVYFIQIFLNMIWTPIFFWKKWLFTALLDIVVLYGFLMANIYIFSLRDQTAALLLVPYAIWLTLATYLNWYIVFNNFEQLQFENLRQMSTPYQQQDYYKRGMQYQQKRAEYLKKLEQEQRLKQEEQERKYQQERRLEQQKKRQEQQQKKKK